jgi:uncharacterized protein (TIGR02145 family)
MADNLRYGGSSVSGGITDYCATIHTWPTSGGTDYGYYTASKNLGWYDAGTANTLYGNCRNPTLAGGSGTITTPCAGSTACGYYYNWQAAIQQPNCNYNNSSCSYSTPTTTTNFLQGICPAGWHLPAGGTTQAASEFVNLDYLNGGTGADRGCSGSDTPCNFFRPGYAFKGLYFGNSDFSGIVGNQGYSGFWWSSTGYSSETGAYFLGVDSTVVYPQFYAGKYNGFAVRCIKNPVASCKIKNCANCSETEVCETCKSGYTLSGNTCVQDCTISHCSICYIYLETIGCSSCEEGYYDLNGHVCMPCSLFGEGCTTCSDIAGCTACADEYGLAAGTCYIIPGVPASITVPATIYNAQTINISWGTATNATGYILERSCGGGTWTQVYSGSATSTTNSVADCATSVAYRVKAYNTVTTVASAYRTSSTITYTACHSYCATCTGAAVSQCGSCKTYYTLSGTTCVVTAFNGNLQDFTAAMCDSFPTPSLPVGTLAEITSGATYTSVGTMTDSRDGNTYEVRKYYDGACWTVKNMVYTGTNCLSNSMTNTTSGACISNSSYGVLYNFTGAITRKICPSPWNAPTPTQVTSLFNKWGENGGYGGDFFTNTNGFKGQLSGGYNTDQSSYFEQGVRGILWTSTPYSSEGYSYVYSCTSTLCSYTNNPLQDHYGAAVRCYIKN